MLSAFHLGSSPALAVSLLLAGHLFGCTDLSDDVRQADDDILATLSSMSLPSIERASTVPIDARPRIVVTANAIELDDVACYRDSPNEFLEVLAEAQFGPDTPVWIRERVMSLDSYHVSPSSSREPEGLMITPLYETLLRWRRLYVDADGRWPPCRPDGIAVFIESDAPYALSGRVLNTIGMAALGDVVLAARRDETIVGIPLRFPRACGPPRTSSTTRPTPTIDTLFDTEPPAPCMASTIALEPRSICLCTYRSVDSTCGWAVAEVGQSAVGNAETCSLPPTGSDARRIGVFEANDANCELLLPNASTEAPERVGAPTMRDELDLDALAVALRERVTLLGACSQATLIPRDDVPWHQVIAVMNVLRRSRYDNVVLGWHRPR